MKTVASRFLEKPHTGVGWWAIGLGAGFTLLFVLVTNDLIHFSGFLTMTIGVVAGLLTLAALIWKRERSWLLWLILVPGLFAILFALGEILVPH